MADQPLLLVDSKLSAVWMNLNGAQAVASVVADGDMQNRYDPPHAETAMALGHALRTLLAAAMADLNDAECLLRHSRRQHRCDAEGAAPLE